MFFSVRNFDIYLTFLFSDLLFFFLFLIDNHRLRFFYSLKGILYEKNENVCLLQVVEFCENLYVNLNWTINFHPFSKVFPST